MTPDSTPELPDWLAADDAPATPDLADLLGSPEPPAVPPPAPPPPAAPAAFVYGTLVQLDPRLASAGGVRVEHDIPPGVRVLGTHPKATRVVAGRTVVWLLDGLPPGARLPIRVKAVATDGVGGPGLGPTAFRVAYAIQTTTRVPLLTPRVAAAWDGPAAVEVDSAAPFTLRVKNTGNYPLRQVVARVTGTGVDVTSDDAVEFPDVAVQEERTAVVRVIGRAAGSASLRVDVTAEPECSAAATAGCEVVAPELALSFDGPDQWHVNRGRELALIVRNVGTADARMTGVRLVLPAGWELVGGTIPFDPASRSLFLDVDCIPAGESYRIPLTVRPTQPGVGVFEARAEDARGGASADLTATAAIDPADSEGLLERFVREVGFAPGGSEASAGPLAPNRDSTGGREHPHVVFSVGGTEYALPLAAVREVGRPPAATPIPGSPDWLAGVSSVRGDIVSLVDLRAFLGEPSAPAGADRRLLVVETPDGELSAGLLVDRVRGIRSIPPDDVRAPAAPITTPAAAYMAGIAAPDRTPLVVLAPARLLLAPEFLPFGPA